jgi:transcriptional regulator with XRE-family HTH domain
MAGLVNRVRAGRKLPTPAMQREIRKAAGVSQAQVAAELGVQRVTVARWETGLRKPSPRLLERYVELLEQLREAVS